MRDGPLVRNSVTIVVVLAVKACRESRKATDDIVFSRLGGEFGVVISKTDNDGLEVCGPKGRAAVAAYSTFSNKENALQVRRACMRAFNPGLGGVAKVSLKSSALFHLCNKGEGKRGLLCSL